MPIEINGKPNTSQIFHPNFETVLSKYVPIIGSEIISTNLESIIASPVIAIPTLGSRE